MESQIFDISGEVVAASDHRIQSLLEQFYGTDVRPRCLCVDGGIEMYVARHWRFVVKRLPGTGKSHHPTCPAYELDPGYSGRDDLASAIDERAGQFVLRVDFPWTRSTREGEGGERTASCAEGETRRTLRRMSLRALTHFVFENAGFNRWSPAMEGRRNQGVLTKYLQRAAAQTIVQGLPLSERLYVPEPFSEATHEAAAQRRRAKLAFLQPVEGRFPLGLIIGEFKAVERAPNGHRVWIKHMPDAPLLVARSAWLRIERSFAPAFEARDADVPVHARLILTGLVRARRENTYELDTACMTVASDQWIIVDSHRELPLLNALVAQRRRFLKPLRYDLRSAAAIPNVLLLDADACPVPMHILSAFMKPAERSAKQAAIRAAGDACWVWEAGTPLPALPRPDWRCPVNSAAGVVR